MLNHWLQKMSKVYSFEALIKKVSDQDATYIEVPFDIKKEFGKGRVKVEAKFDEVLYNGYIVNMSLKNEDGSICYIIGINKDIRKKLNKETGDSILVEIKESV